MGSRISRRRLPKRPTASRTSPVCGLRIPILRWRSSPIEITVDDPGTYSRPITYEPTYTMVAHDDLLEYFCTENEKSAEHYR